MPGRPRPDSPLHLAETDLRRRLAADALVEEGGSIAGAARALGIAQATLRRVLREHDLDPAELAVYRHRETPAAIDPDDPAPPEDPPVWTWLAPEARRWAPWLGGDGHGKVWREALADLRARMVRAALEDNEGSTPLAAAALGVCSTSIERWRSG